MRNFERSPRKLLRTFAIIISVALVLWAAAAVGLQFAGGVGRVFRVGSLPPINSSLVAFYNVENPSNVGPDWTLRFTIQFLFPR